MLVFLFSVTRPGFLMSREKYYTHAVGQRQKYYEAERILLVLADKRSVAQPSILLWRKMYDITLYFSVSFFFSLFFFVPRTELSSTDWTTEAKRNSIRKEEKNTRKKRKSWKIASRADLWKQERKNKIKIIYHNFSPSLLLFCFGSLCPTRPHHSPARSTVEWSRYYSRRKLYLQPFFAFLSSLRSWSGLGSLDETVVCTMWEKKQGSRRLGGCGDETRENKLYSKYFPFISESLGFLPCLFVVIWVFMYTSRIERAQSKTQHQA